MPVGHDDLPPVGNPDPDNAGFARVANRVSIAVFEHHPPGVSRQAWGQGLAARPAGAAEREQPDGTQHAGPTRSVDSLVSLQRI